MRGDVRDGCMRSDERGGAWESCMRSGKAV
jgi:hypothetical protein